MKFPIKQATSMGCSYGLRWATKILRPENERGTLALSNGTKMKFIAQVFPQNPQQNVKERNFHENQLNSQFFNGV